MKIMNQVTIRYLKENKKRTIFTLLCMTISVIMISCIGIGFYSGKAFVKDYIEKTVGDYHYCINSDDSQIIDIIENDSKVEEYYLSKTLSGKMENSDLSIWIDSGDYQYFQNKHLSQYLIEGRLPRNTQEIVISQNYLKIINQSNKKIGDTVTFQFSNDDKDIMEQYKIVGIMNEYKTEYDEFSALTYIDLNMNDYYLSVYVKDKDVSNHIFNHTSEIEKNTKSNIAIVYNSSYLAIQDIFEEGSQSSFINVYKMVAAIIIIIMFISYFIIYQAFHLSTYDRIQYLGMLSSVGATPRQKRHSIYFEGLLLSIIAIPLGIIASFVGLSIVFLFINQMPFLKSMNLSIHTHISLEYLGMIIILSLIIVMLSLYLPARKISKISVIDALNKSDEIKVKKKKLKQGRLIKRFLNIQQQLAIKNYKRQGKRSQIIVFSLVASMIAFVSMYSFGNRIVSQFNNQMNLKNYDVEAQFNHESKEIMINYLKNNPKIEQYMLYSEIPVFAKIDQSYIDFDIKQTNASPEFYDGYSQLEIIAVAQQVYNKICQENNIDIQKNQGLLFNTPIYYFEDENKTDEENISKNRYKKMDQHFIQSMYYQDIDNESNDIKENIRLFDSLEIIQKDTYDFNNESGIVIIVSEEKMLNITRKYNVTQYCDIKTQQHEEVASEIDALQIGVYDYTGRHEQQLQLSFAVSVFVYGFVCMMIIFALLNIMNMMSASIEKRKKEFGMMLSVGMSPHYIKKMIFYESFMYGIKTFLYGFPLSLLVEWILYKQIEIGNTVFIPSWIAYIISFIVIMLVMLLTFRIGLQRFEKQNIIETLKDDM